MLLPLFDRNPTKRIPWLTLLLIVTNLGIHGYVSRLGVQQQIDLVVEHGMVPERLSQIDSDKPIEVEIEWKDERGRPRVHKQVLSTDRGSVYASLLTMMFLHGSWLHVLSNMWMLWIFGNNVEDRLGHFIFLGFYLMGGFLASYCHWMSAPLSETPVVGASGAVAALLGGYAVTYPKAKVLTLIFIGIPLLLNLPALLVIAIWFVIDLTLAFWMMQGQAADSIAHWAHVGGCVSGALLMPLFSVGASPPEADWRSEAEEMLNPIQDEPSRLAHEESNHKESDLFS